jgi:glutaredoxin
MDIIAYTLPGCSHCKSLRELFARANKEYTEIVVKKDIEVETFQQSFPGIRQFPYVVIDNKPVGGLMETVVLFVKEGLVSSSKKNE